MNELSPSPVRRRILWRLLFSFCVFALVAGGLLGWYITTDSFQQRVRRKIVTELEKATGGRVELGEFHTIPLQLRIDARNLTVHGGEAPGEHPFLQIERVQAEMKIISLLSTTIGVHSLVLEHPQVHVIDYPDGSTNIPTPRIAYRSDEAPIDRLISLSVSKIEVQRGELLWQDRKVPFSFAGRDVGVLLDYSLLHDRYEAELKATVDTQWQQYSAFTWTGNASMLLARGRIDVSSLTVQTGKTELHFAGRLEDPHDPKITGEYNGVADIGEVAAILREPHARKGTVHFAGRGTWSLREFSGDGTLQAKDIEWIDEKLELRDARLDTAFSVTPLRLRLSSLKANVFGGDLAGDVDVTNWQSSLEPAPQAGRHHVIGKISPSALQRGSVRLQIFGLPISPVLRFLNSKSLPVGRLNFAGDSSGSVDLLWVGSIRDAEMRMKIDLVTPRRPSPSDIPLKGQIEAVYRGSRDELEVHNLRLSSNGSEITASGTLAATSSMRFTLKSYNLKEWQPLIEAAYGSSTLPFIVHGWASVSGDATGRVSAFSFNGNLEVYDFDTTVPAAELTRERTIHWDALSTSIQYSPTSFAAHNGSLIHDRTVAHFDLSGSLAKGQLAQGAPLFLHLDVLDADVAEVAEMAGIGRPLTGNLAFSLNLSGTRSNPHGTGHFEVRNATGYGLVVPLFSGDLRLAHNELRFNNVLAKAYDADFSAHGTIDAETRELRATIEGQRIDFAKFPRLQSSRFTLDGIADFTAQVSGTPQMPSVEAHVRVKDLALDKERTGDFYLDANTQGRMLSLKAHSDFERSDLAIQGTIDLEKDFPADLSLDFHRLNVESLLNIYLPGKITGGTPIEGTIRVRGPLRDPRELKANAEIRSFAAEVEHVKIATVEPIRLEVTSETLLLENFHLAGSGTDFAAHGRAHLTGSQETDLQLTGSVNMALLQSLNPKILARGSLELNVLASGKIRQPAVQGRIEVKNTYLSHNDFPSGLSDLNGVLVFDGHRIQIEKLSGTTGGGTIALTGSANYQDGLLSLDLGATAQGVRLRYPPGVSSTANADLRLTGTTNSALLSGDVVITKLAITPGFDFAAYMASSRQAISFTQSDSLASRLRLDVHLTTTPELQMETAIARLSGDADLRARGTADRPVIVGRVEVLEGTISFNGTRYQLERGDVTFANPAKTQPIVDLQATTRVRDYDITVRVQGDVTASNKLRLTWQSEPPLPEQDVIALLALGRTRDESASLAQAGGGSSFGGDASNLLINEALNSAVSSRVQRLFGVSRIKIDPQGLANETSVVRGPQLTVEQQVVSNLNLTYSTNVSVSTQQIIQAEYTITRNISIVALRDQNGVVSFDLKIRTRRK
ncbi:MAG TPA: translocation/assembly module TamB domain-containing protein [Terriglobales bacterium]|nr:translocation/assembly module TamB domain-containing protein [Terriglobales bacterium]